MAFETPTNYTPTPNTTRPALIDHLRGIDNALGGATGTTNLAFANQTTTTADITSSTGADATMTSATALLAGLMNAADKTKVEFITVTQAVDLDAMEQDIADHQAALGIADGDQNFGTFTGALLSDNQALKPILQELETAVEGIPSRVQDVVANIAARDALTGSSSGDLVFVTDATADATVAAGGAMYIWNGAAWEKVAEAESLDVVTNLAVANITATGLDVTSSSGTDATLPAATNAAAGVATAAQIADLEDAITLTGLAGNSTDFGANLTGNVVTDNQNLLNVLIQLEAGLEIQTATDAQLAAATDARNTAGKYEGRRYRVTDRDNTIVFSQGTAATAVWTDGSGLYEVTPA